ncbi:MAG: hypothetical protein BroJett021_27780 [Chloroflexota bacterium]|jgi:hypothetical protein|nr:hypothetical protein [Caldilinea sp.]GIK73790.1 MAG: hypothetical protein BroJett021_27780 [Chloroflexota bacterium]
MIPSPYIGRLAGAALIALWIIALTPALVSAQDVENAAEQPTIDSPLLPSPSPATPSPTSTPSTTPTDTPRPTPTATPTLDLAAAALQVSPLRIVADDRPIAANSAMLWVALAATIVAAGAGVMVIAQQRENRR